MAQFQAGVPYTAQFYAQHATGSYESALRILAPIFATLSPTSMVDYGCGAHGAWLRAAHSLGATTLHGFDGEWSTPTAAAPYTFALLDLEARVPDAPRADLAISLEVAEHLMPQAAGRLVDALCATADVVLFGAASPGQGGTGHINEQPPSHWIGAFDRRGFACLDLIRPRFWYDAAVEPWYRQNTMLFLKRDAADHATRRDRLTAALAVPPVVDFIHPAILAGRVDSYERQLTHYWHPSFRNCLGMLRRWVEAKVGLR